jgi:hypothetical protein
MTFLIAFTAITLLLARCATLDLYYPTINVLYLAILPIARSVSQAPVSSAKADSFQVTTFPLAASSAMTHIAQFAAALSHAILAWQDSR